MRRVLLLVCLIVSVVELDWERDRIYLLSSIASLLLFLYQRTDESSQSPKSSYSTSVQDRGEGVSSEAYVSDSLHPDTGGRSHA